MDNVLNPIDYYRMPWSLTDNILCWLEPTKRCNLYCEGCYSRNEKNSDKTLSQIRSDMDLFVAKRRSDSISITGGDPLLHPDIVEIVRMVKHDYGLKPVLNTNGLALDKELLRRLKQAGLFGFTFHIDSGQRRPNWTGKNELELNELRLHYAEMVAEVGGISVSFNSTVYTDTLKYIPGMLKWAHQHIDIVHNMVLILFRTTSTASFDYYAKGEKIDPERFIYYDESKNPDPLNANQVVSKIRESDPNFDPCSYLGGTKDPNSFKWLVTVRAGDKDEIYGYMGKRFMEVVQSTHHLWTGRYLAYSSPDMLKFGKSVMFSMSSIDKGARKATKRYLNRVRRYPNRIASDVRLQSIVIIQPIDMMASGEMNMCDGCPDITIHNGELLWSCRLDEQLQFGCFLTAAPQSREAQKGDKEKSAPDSERDPEIQPQITA